MRQEELRCMVVDIYQTGYSRKNGEQQANDYVKERIEAITKLFLESLPKKMYDPTRVCQPDYADDVTVGKVYGFNNCIDQITKRWRG